MQILSQTSDQLVLHDSPWGLRAMGALFGLGGAGIIAAMISGRHAGEHNAWVAFVVGGMFATIGFWMLATAADRRIVFDRLTKSAQLIRRGGLRSTEVSDVPFATVRDIALESSSQLSNNRATTTTYRIVFVMRDGSRIPWTNLLTADVGNQARCASAARAFGGWDTAAARSGAGVREVARPTPPTGAPALPASSVLSTGSRPTTPVAPPATVVKPTVQHLGCAGVFLSLFSLIGIGMLALQVDRLLTWRPVTATVLSSEVVSVKGSKGGTSYSPRITYSYQVSGRAYTSSSVSILNESRSWAWAQKIAGRYPVGSQATAYFDPSTPSKTFLIHELSFFPFVFLIIPLAFMAVLVWSVRWNARQAALAAAAPVPVLPTLPLAPPKAA